MLLVLVIEKATASVLSLIIGLCGESPISPGVLLSHTKAFPVNDSVFVDCVLCIFLG